MKKRVKNNGMSEAPGLAIISEEEWMPGFDVDSKEIVDSLMQQFQDTYCFIRELGQNSQDAKADRVKVTFSYSEAEKLLSCVWMDNGCGMNYSTITRNYLTLFDSSKDEDPDAVGCMGLGRISALAIEGVVSLELVTLSLDDVRAYNIFISKTFAGKVCACDQAQAKALLAGSDSGTIIQVKIRMELAAAEDFITKARTRIKKDLKWTVPQITVCFPEWKKGVGAGISEEGINENFDQLPGRLSLCRSFRLAESGSSGRIHLTVQPDHTSAATPHPGAEGVIFSSGGIPLETPYAVEWVRGKEAFNLGPLALVIDSHQFAYPIGRNTVFRDDFYNNLVGKVFEKILLPYYEFLCECLRDRSLRYGYGKSITKAVFDLLYYAHNRAFGSMIPQKIFEAPLFKRYGEWDESISFADIKSAAKVYFSSRKPEITLYRSYVFQSNKNDQNRSKDHLILDVSSMPWTGIELLKHKYGSVETKQDYFVKTVDEDNYRVILNRIRRSLEHLVDKSMFNSFSKKIRGINIRLGELSFLSGDKAPETVAAYFEEEKCIYLNTQNLIVMSLLEKYTKENRIAEHFILREILFAEGLDIPQRLRQEIMKNDLNIQLQRSRHDAERGPTHGDGIEIAGFDIEAMMEFIRNNNKEISL